MGCGQFETVMEICLFVPNEETADACLFQKKRRQMPVCSKRRDGREMKQNAREGGEADV